MRPGSRFVCAMTVLVSTVMLTVTAQAGEASGIKLTHPPALHHTIAALPKLANPAGDPAAQRINHALASLDRAFLGAAAGCNHFDAQRTVDVALDGRRFVGLVAHESWYCGGAYPDSGALALTYDGQTGRPVNWLDVLPSSWHLQSTSDSDFEGSTIGMVQSPALSAVLQKIGPSEKPDADCNPVFEREGLAFQAWPSAAEDGVAFEPGNLIHAENVCAVPFVVPTAELRRLGADKALLDDIDAAHARLPHPPLTGKPAAH